MKRKLSMLLVCALVLLALAPRVYCLCENHPLLVLPDVAADAPMACCRSDVESAQNGIQCTDGRNCFTPTDQNLLAFSVGISMPTAVVLPAVDTGVLRMFEAQEEKPPQAAFAHPPPRHPPGISLHLYHCVILS